MLKNNPNIRQVYLCLDSDEPGQTAAKRIANKLLSRGSHPKSSYQCTRAGKDLLAAGTEEQEKQLKWGIQLSCS